ncbi:fungal-specific transcription factor domain-domain-containing protein [Clohesyomyces aquaticus]|uniref:Fungal-specific transcription factor domain-domain-containing protein n=1 Tax=Clohesyomyces aquaticus TaxID=1231657 RepID=A0A1Y1ZIT7_9PLEO|nr:fungal-specific transcription factor domain-domain-containing protein [Clohesyomyces aquaticus]
MQAESVPPTPKWVHVTGNPGTERSSDAADADHGSPPTKRRREDKERTRVSRACDRCKRKKTRCTGRCPCALCLRAGLPCEFTASYTRGRLPSVIVDETAIAESNTPRRALPEEASLPDISVTSSSDPASIHLPLPVPTTDRGSSSSSSIKGVLAVPDDGRREPLSRNSPEPTQTDQQGHYVGPSSGASFLIRIQKRLHQNSSLSQQSSIFTFGDAPLPEFDPSFFVMPPKPDAQRLVERYFDFASPTHRFLHRPTIEKMLHEFYDTMGDMRNKDDAPARAALLLIVFAQAQAHMPGSASEGADRSARYFFAADHQMSKERGAVRLTSVQARLVQCFYLLTQSRINHCWSLFGTTAHLALAIGLHRSRRCEPSGTTDHIELESRKRLFWCAYCLDKYLAAALGRPRTFKDEDIDQELPVIVNDSDLTATSIKPPSSRTQSVMMAPVEHMKISRIVSLILRDLYPIRPPSMALRIELAAKYSRDLREWRMNVAQFLDADDVNSSMLIPLFQRQRNVLNLAYWHAILLVQRPFLLSNFASLAYYDHRPGNISNIDTTSNITDCLEAAMAIVHIVDELFQGNGVFRAFWFTQYYAFCAVVVLYIYRIQQHFVEPGKCEGFFAAGQRCQAQLSSISETDCLSKRYCLVLEELRLEAARQTEQQKYPGLMTSPSGQNDHLTLPKLSPGFSVSSPTPQGDAGVGFAGPFSYGGNIPPTPEPAVFNTILPSNSLMADLTSWGQFDSLVTAGIGVLDGSFAGDFGFGFS